MKHPYNNTSNFFMKTLRKYTKIQKKAQPKMQDN